MAPITPKVDPLAEMARKMKALEEENAKLKEAQKHKGKLTLKVSGKGGVSVYGFGRFPVTLYANQWAQIVSDSFVKEMAGFLDTHKSVLATKDSNTVKTGPVGAEPAPKSAF